MTLHDSDLAQALAWAVELSERCDEAEREAAVQTRYSAYLASRLLQAERERALYKAQRDKALDWAEREQSHRLDVEGSDRLLADIERMHDLQHGGGDD